VNENRRKRVRALAAHLETHLVELKALHTEEWMAFNCMPENLRDSNRGLDASVGEGQLDEAEEALVNCCSAISDLCFGED
jgi:hypothetical protein